MCDTVEASRGGGGVIQKKLEKYTGTQRDDALGLYVSGRMSQAKSHVTAAVRSAIGLCLVLSGCVACVYRGEVQALL